MTPNRSYFVQARYFLLVMIVLSGLVLLATVVWLSHPATVSANSNDLASVDAKYPNIVGTRIDSCSLCHTSAPALNAYGAAYLAAGRNTAAFAAIENLDSDGDGWTNIQEIMALTFPGNTSDHPAASSPTPSATATTGPTATSSSTATPGPTQTSTKVVSPTMTRTPHPDHTPEATRTPRVDLTPTPCTPEHHDESFTNQGNSWFMPYLMDYRRRGCSSDGGRGHD
jgi:hypothetical protein